MSVLLDRLTELGSLLWAGQLGAAYRKLQMWLGTRQTRFSIIYEDNLWLSPESRSGPGSEVASTRFLRSTLPDLLHRHCVQTFLDAPCGDFNWMQLVDLGDIRYVGVDIVKAIVIRNATIYAGRRRVFLHLNLLKDRLPDADLILCRDCLIHFSYRDTRTAIDAFKRTGARYLLTNTYTSIRENRDIRTGNWRPINLEIDPFCFPTPLESICESREQHKILALFELDAIYGDLRHGRER